MHAVNWIQSRRTLADLVASEIRERILSGQLPMGAEVNQVALTQELGVSRAVVREAFRQLEAAGLLHLTPYHRAVVTRLEAPDVDDLWEVRAIVEVLALRRVMRQDPEEALQLLLPLHQQMLEESKPEGWLELDRRLHRALCECSRNPLLVKVLDAVRLPIDRFLQAVSASRPRMETANREHAALLEAIRQRSLPEAEHRLREHIERTRRMIRERLQEVPLGAGGAASAGASQVPAGTAEEGKAR